jgi:CO/xanthine dehydrogenase Mo-binding subunit
MDKQRYVGNPDIKNVDGFDKVTGRARYIGDMKFPGMLYAKVLRSSIPHARIKKLDIKPALAVPGVCAAITYADFKDNGNFGWPVRDAFILAYHKARYVGDPIAVIAAENLEAAQAGVEAVVLELEPLPVLTSPKLALDPSSPIIPEYPPLMKANLCAEHIVRYGNPQSLFANCALTFQAEYDMPHQEHAYMETEGAIAIPEVDGSVTVYANNQSPFINREYIASVLDLPIRSVRVIQPFVGGSFGGKDDTVYQTSAQVARLALITGRPVRLIFTRSESIIASYKRQAMQVNISVCADALGNLQGAEINLLADSGAYASMTPMSSWRATMHAAGAYRYKAVHVNTQAVYTNNGYSGAFRGFGNTLATAAIEIAIDECAEQWGFDPLAFRLQNCLRNDDRTMTGDLLAIEVGLPACLEWVRDASDWHKKRGIYAHQEDGSRYRNGIGVASYFHGSALGAEGKDAATSTIAIENDGSFTITSGLTDYGQGSRTVFSVIAAEIMGIELDRIHILRPDTHTAIDSGPTVASRASIVGGNSIRVAAQKIKQTLQYAAANLIGCMPQQLIQNGEAFIGPDENPVSLDSVIKHAREMGVQLSAEGYWQVPEIEWDFEKGTGKPYFSYVFGAQVAEVQVDLHTGKIQVTAIWAAHDAGTILYPSGAMGQMYGGIAQGIGLALTEDFPFINGIPQNVDLAHYRLPRSTDVPDIHATFIQTHHRDGPFGAKNLAEPVMIGTAPAIANAVYHASGIRVRKLPIRLPKK